MVSIAIQMLYAIFCKQLNRDTLSKNIQMKKAKWSLKSRGGLHPIRVYVSNCVPLQSTTLSAHGFYNKNIFYFDGGKYKRKRIHMIQGQRGKMAILNFYHYEAPIITK